MNRFILTVLLIVASFWTATAQDGMKLGINAALPVGDAGDFYSFGASADLAFIWGVSDNFGAGIVTGFTHYFGKDVDDVFVGDSTIEVEVSDYSFIPVAGTARFNVSESFTLGADIGYALAVTDGADGGFYYAPRVQYGVSETMDIVLSYRGVSANGGSFDAIALGLQFGL